MFRYTKKELRNFFIVILTLTFVFAFNDGRPSFELYYWLTNFVKVFLIVTLGILVHDLGHDFIVRKQGFNSEFKYWGLKRFSIRKEPFFPRQINIFGKKYTIESFPLGILMAILITLFSNGQLYWAAISSYSLLKIKAHRLGRKFVEVTDFEEAKIAIAGPLAMLFLMVLLKIFNTGGIFDQFVSIYSIVIVYDMLPLPGLDGFKVVMGSKPLFAFGFAFIVSAVLLINALNSIFALLLAVLISLIIGLVYFYFKIFK